MQVAGVGEGFHLAIGIGIVSSQAFSIGATAIPGPLSEMEWGGWMYHRILDLHAVTATIGDNNFSNTVWEEIDSKAMRKISSNEVLVAMVEAVEVGTASMDIYFDTRVLLKLS